MIKKIKWRNYKSLGNLELDFTDSNGKPYNTIILAGENGSGKTTVLDTLFEFLNLGTFSPFEYIDYNVVNTDFKLTQSDDTNVANGYHLRHNIMHSTYTEIMSDRHNNLAKIHADSEDVRYYGVAYSKSRVGFQTQAVMGVTNKQLDVSKYENETETEFSDVKQLLVDLETQDNAEWMRISREKRPINLEQFDRQYAKLRRFKFAFNNFFEKLKFDRIDNNSIEGKEVIFKKDNVEIKIDDLSSGEKQIVYRGAKLLRNVNALDGAVVLIDEPELSLHPVWQARILDYYMGLFKKGNRQTVQMFIATHSEYVIRSVLNNNNNVLILLLKEVNNSVQCEKITKATVKNCVLSPTTAAEINYLAFHTDLEIYHIELYGALQQKTKTSNNVKKCDDYIKKHKLYVPSKHAKPYLHGSTQYETVCTYIRNCINHPDRKHTYTAEELQVSIELLRQLV